MEEINLIEVFEYYKNKLIWILASILVVILLGNIFTIATRVPMYKSNTTILLVGSNEKVNQNDVSLNNNLQLKNYQIVLQLELKQVHKLLLYQ